jgi:hypothetical protein
MRRFGLVGVALVLLAGSAPAQTAVNVTTIRDGRQQITVIERVAADRVIGPGGPTLDQLGYRQGRVCGPKGCSVWGLGDQPALLGRLPALDRATAAAVVALSGKGDELPRPALLNEKRADDSKDEKKVGRELPVPATMLTLETRDWFDGGFLDDCDRRWCLVKGCPLPAKLAKMRGWLVESDGKKLYFVHESGNIYVKQAAVAP